MFLKVIIPSIPTLINSEKLINNKSNLLIEKSYVLTIKTVQLTAACSPPPQPNTVPNCSEIGILRVLSGLIGAIQANEVLKIICEIGQVLSGKLFTFNALTMEQNILSYKKVTPSKLHH